MSSILTHDLILAQTDTATKAAPIIQPWWHLLIDNALALSVLLIFITSIITLIIQQRKKDKCLKLLRDHHVTYLDSKGNVIWGDLEVFSKGLSLLFDAPFITRRGLAKTAALIYEKELEHCVAICRCEGALTQEEKHERQKQIRRSFEPNLFRRFCRWMRNLCNTLRDAFSKAFSTLLGAAAKSTPTGALNKQKSSLEKIGATIIGSTDNAYEPILEKLIGKPVVLSINNPLLPDAAPNQFPGYLVDYTDHYIAVFNTEQTISETMDIAVTESTQLQHVQIDSDDHHVTITCTGGDAIIVDNMTRNGETIELDVALLPGCKLKLGHHPDDSLRLKLHRTCRIDIVCPRKIATIYFGSEQSYSPRRDIHGAAPEEAVHDEDESL